MPALSEYTNVHDSAVSLLRRKGYQVWRDDEQQLYGCERGGWDFFADSPVGLLGLVAMFEAARPADYREYWWRDPRAAAACAALPTSPVPYRSVVTRA
jgi:hypothetical protein